MGQARERLDKYCTVCHDETPYAGLVASAGHASDLRGDTLPRELVVRMADQIAFGKMPKAPMNMPPAERDALIGELIGALWPAGPAREEAARYYQSQTRGLPVEPIDNALRLIRRAAGGESEADWGLLERSLWTDQASYTPGFAAVTALEALRVCKESRRGGTAALERCLEHSLSTPALVRGKVR